MPRLQTTPLDGEGCGLWLNLCLIHMSSKPCPVPSSAHIPRSGEHRFSETGAAAHYTALLGGPAHANWFLGGFLLPRVGLRKTHT